MGKTYNPFVLECMRAAKRAKHPSRLDVEWLREISAAAHVESLHR